MTDGMGIAKIGGLNPAMGVKMERVAGAQEAQKGFKEMLVESIENAERLEKEAETAMSKLQMGQSDPVREALAAAHKAEVAFQTLMQIRDGLMAAYREINDMRFS